MDVAVIALVALGVSCVLLLIVGFSGAALVVNFIETLKADKAYLRERVTDLENRLASHSWQEYAAMSEIPTPLTRSTKPTNGFGEERSEEAYGETAEDVLASYLASNGVDLEGPTVG